MLHRGSLIAKENISARRGNLIFEVHPWPPSTRSLASLRSRQPFVKETQLQRGCPSAMHAPQERNWLRNCVTSLSLNQDRWPPPKRIQAWLRRDTNRQQLPATWSYPCPR